MIPPTRASQWVYRTAEQYSESRDTAKSDRSRDKKKRVPPTKNRSLFVWQLSMVLYEYAVGKKIEAVNTKETIERDVRQMSINSQYYKSGVIFAKGERPGQTTTNF